MMPSSVLLMMASSEDSTMAANRASGLPACSAFCFSSRRRSVTSRKTSTQPTIWPSLPRIGAALSSMGRSVPSLAMRTVWFASPTTTPSRNALVAGFSTGWRVSSFTMRNTASSGWPVGLVVRPAGQRLGHGVHAW